MAKGERSSKTSRQPILFREAATWLLGSAGILGLVLLSFGCGANGEGSRSATEERAVGAPTYSQGGPGLRAASTSKKPEAPQIIAGMNADAVLNTLLKSGLECWHRAQTDALYACSSEESHSLKSLYEAEIKGGGIDRVSGVEARVFRRSAEDFESASRSFLSFLATQLEYRGADSEEAHEFVNRALSSGEATTTIGMARWMMKATDDSTVLRLTPAR